MCSALIGKNEQKIFFENKQIPKKIKKYFPKKTKIHTYSEMNEVLKKSCKKSSKIIIDKKKLSLFNFNLLQKVTKNLLIKDDILLSYRSIKNSTEIKCSIKAHILDAVSLCKFLYWYKNFDGILSELDVVEKLILYGKKTLVLFVHLFQQLQEQEKMEQLYITNLLKDLIKKLMIMIFYY